MADRIVRSRFPSRASVARKSLWLFQDFASITLTAAGGTIVTSLNAAALALLPFTVVRTRMELMVYSDQEAASEKQAGAWGAAVVSEEAQAVGVSAVPTPVTEAGSDLWFAYQEFFGGFQFTTSGAGQVGQRYTVDSKAMRKVGVGQTIVTVAEFSSAGGDGLVLKVAGRMLLKLH